MRRSLVAPLVALAASPARAETLGPVLEALRPSLVEAASLIALGLVGWAATLFRRWTGIEIEARYRDSLHRAAVTGLQAALNRLAGRAGTASLAQMSGEGAEQVVREATAWVRRSVPDAVAHLRADPERVAEIVRAKLAEAALAGPDRAGVKRAAPGPAGG